MRLPTPRNPFKRRPARAPRWIDAVAAPVRALGPGSVSSVLKVALDAAYVLLWLITGLLLLLLIAAIFSPLDNVNITVSGQSGGRQLPLTRLLLLFGLMTGTLRQFDQNIIAAWVIATPLAQAFAHWLSPIVLQRLVFRAGPRRT